MAQHKQFTLYKGKHKSVSGNFYLNVFGTSKEVDSLTGIHCQIPQLIQTSSFNTYDDKKVLIFSELDPVTRKTILKDITPVGMVDPNSLKPLEQALANLTNIDMDERIKRMMITGWFENKKTPIILPVGFNKRYNLS